MEESKKCARTRRDISNSLLDLMLEKDFQDISVTDICEKALITRATFYKYYEDKYHLISCIIEDHKNMLIGDKIINYEYSTPKAFFMDVAKICLDSFIKNKETLSVYLKHLSSDKLTLLLIENFNTHVEEMLKNQKMFVKYKAPITLLSKFFSGGIIHLGFYLLEENTKYTEEDILVFLNLVISEKLFA